MPALHDGVDAVVHLGGASYEKPFPVVMKANLEGLFNLYEAAREAGTRRIVFASSDHVTGCWASTSVSAPPIARAPTATAA